MKFHLISLGCDKNLVDSEFMLGLLSQHGFDFTQDESEADVIVVNTCCFIHDAKQESIDTVLRVADYKDNNLKCLAVSGCLAQRYHEEMKEELPEIDVIIGTADFDRIVTAVNEYLDGIGLHNSETTKAESGKSESSKAKVSYVSDASALPKPDCTRIISTPGHFEYLKIAEGCDKHCTYCIIPSIRGSYRSYPMEFLIKQAQKLAAEGVRELIIVAQETTVYGVDLYGRKALPELLCQLSEIEEIDWIRLLYAYPEEITDELIEVMSTNPKILHYIDMPIQHASDAVLKRMGRWTNQSEIRDKVAKLRNAIPDIAIRTTLITGFPGETQGDHEELYRFVNEMEFDRLGVFTYSQEEDTPAAEFDNQVDESVKRERYAELMELQQAVVFDKNEELVGNRMQVIVEGYLPEDGIYVTRTYRDAPDIDGFLFLNTEREHMTGDIVSALVTQAREYDLEGEEIYESAE